MRSAYFMVRQWILQLLVYFSCAFALCCDFYSCPSTWIGDIAVQTVSYAYFLLATRRKVCPTLTPRRGFLSYSSAFVSILFHMACVQRWRRWFSFFHHMSRRFFRKNRRQRQSFHSTADSPQSAPCFPKLYRHNYYAFHTFRRPDLVHTICNALTPCAPPKVSLHSPNFMNRHCAFL